MLLPSMIMTGVLSEEKFCNGRESKHRMETKLER